MRHNRQAGQPGRKGWLEFFLPGFPACLSYKKGTEGKQESQGKRVEVNRERPCTTNEAQQAGREAREKGLRSNANGLALQMRLNRQAREKGKRSTVNGYAQQMRHNGQVKEEGQMGMVN
eukprot:5752-Pelagomonas_calceolata.AAC.1